MKQQKGARTKIKLVSIGICCGFLFIMVQLFYLQIVRGNFFLTKSKKNCLRLETVQSLRGNILDCNGKLLATNRPIYNIIWKGSGERHFTQEQKNKLAQLEAFLDRPLLNDDKLMEQLEHAERHCTIATVANDVLFEQLSQIEEAFSQENNIAIDTSFKRFYPCASQASHVLGYLGRMEEGLAGKMGLEQLCETSLKGKCGTRATTVNSAGRKLAETLIEQSLTGADLKTTIDLDIQAILEAVFPEYFTGTCIVMDTNNGALVGLLSRPNFDPNIFLGPMLQEDWQRMQHDHPFLNRAFNALYPLGSIFKLVVSSAALETGIITQNTVWNCTGSFDFAGRAYHCHLLNGHGRLSASQALEQSCDPFFYNIGTKISIDTLSDYAHRFGLGEKTNIIFPEKEGLVPCSAWKRRVKKQPWYPGETLSAAIGQSYLLVTPLQVARLVAGIFSNTLVTPRILQEEPIVTSPLRIQKRTLEFLRQSMKKVVTQGTGRRISQVKDIEIYAKTSTAQTSDLSFKNKGLIYQEHGWLAAQFQYKKCRPLTMVILVEHAGSSSVSTGIAAEFLTLYKQLIDQRDGTFKPQPVQPIITTPTTLAVPAPIVGKEPETLVSTGSSGTSLQPTPAQ
jgi:penicillin-binding protein 2